MHILQTFVHTTSVVTVSIVATFLNCDANAFVKPDGPIQLSEVRLSGMRIVRDRSRENDIVDIHVGSKATADDFKGAVSGLKQLTTLSFNSVSSINKYINVIKNVQIDTLTITACDVTNLSFDAIHKHTTIRDLFLSKCNYDLESFKGIASRKGLKLISISGMKVEPNVIGALSKSESLDVVQFHNCALSKQAIDNLRLLTNVTAIYLVDEPFTDNDISILVGLPKLTSVKMDGTRVSDEGLSNLLDKKKGIEFVSIRRTRTTKVAVELLREKYPTVTIAR